jgi:hypothetical protein
MNGQPVAILMALEATRRNIHEPQPAERPRRRTRRAAARALQAAAHRLDSHVAPAPRASLSR